MSKCFKGDCKFYLISCLFFSHFSWNKIRETKKVLLPTFLSNEPVYVVSQLYERKYSGCLKKPLTGDKKELGVDRFYSN